MSCTDSFCTSCGQCKFLLDIRGPINGVELFRSQRRKLSSKVKSSQALCKSLTYMKQIVFFHLSSTVEIWDVLKHKKSCHESENKVSWCMSELINHLVKTAETTERVFWTYQGVKVRIVLNLKMKMKVENEKIIKTCSGRWLQILWWRWNIKKNNKGSSTVHSQRNPKNIFFNCITKL